MPMDEEFMEEETMIIGAIGAARKAFEEFISKENVDAAFYTFKLEVCFLDSTFTIPLRKFTFEDPVLQKEGEGYK